MLGIDGPELILIAVVALIFIGPKELPGMLRTVGKWVATARGLASEFRGHVDDMVRQADVEDLKKTVDPNAILDVQGLNPLGQIRSEMEAGAAEAQAEMDKAKAIISDTTGEAPSLPPVETAELAPPVDVSMPAAHAATAIETLAVATPMAEIAVAPAPAPAPKAAVG